MDRMFRLLMTTVLLVGAASCVCPTYKCVTPPTVTFDVRGRGDVPLSTAVMSGGAAESTLVAVSADGCFSPPCTHQYFEEDAEGRRVFSIRAEGYLPAELEVVVDRTESGCSAVPQRLRVVLVEDGSTDALSSSAESLAAGCGN